MIHVVREHFAKALTPALGKVSTASEPHVAADGRVVFTGGVLEQFAGRFKSCICLADFDSSSVEIIEAGAHENRSPQWSPDGSRLAFLSDSSEPGSFQLHLIAWHDKEKRVTPCATIAGTVEYFSWSPSGKYILAGATTHGSDVAGSEGSGTAGPAAKAGVPWTPFVDRGVFEERGRSLWVYDVEANAVKRIPLEIHPWEGAWCGDDAIVTIASIGATENDWFRPLIAHVDADTAEYRIVRRPRRQAGVPRCSATGRYASWVEAVCSDRRVVAGDVVLQDLKEERRIDVPTLGVDVTDLSWIGDQHLFFIGQRNLDCVAGVYEVNERRSIEVWSTDRSCGKRYPSASPLDESHFVAVIDGYDMPQAIARIGPGGIETTVSLAHEGTDYVREAGGKISPFRWTARDGLQIEGLLTTPDGDGPHPLVVSIHGGPVFAWRNAWSMMSTLTPILVKRGFAVLHTNPRGSTGRGQPFAEMVVGDLCGEEIYDHLTGIDALVAAGIADPRRLAVMGRSHGGQATSWMITQTDRFRAAVAVSPFTNFVSARYQSNMGIFFQDFLRDDDGRPDRLYERSPIYRARHVRTPVLLIAGGRDRCTPPSQCLEFHQALMEHGRISELVIYPEEGHGMRELDAQIDHDARIIEWIERYMGE